jgi:hypothetical protein
MSEYSIKVGRDDDFVRARGVQQFDFTNSVMKTNPFSMYIDHGALSDFIDMGHLVMLYHNQERIFKGRILGFDEDDDGIAIAGNDMSVAFPNVYVDLTYESSSDLRDLLYDIMHSTSSKRHVDNIDAETYVRPTNLERQWGITDKPLMTLLTDLVPSSQDPTGFRRNTFFLDAYDKLYVEPIGGGGEYKGSIDVQKRKIGSKIDGSFCNYSVFRGSRSVPDPASRDSWTEGDAANRYDSVTGNMTFTDSKVAMKNQYSVKGVFDLTSVSEIVVFDYGNPRNFEGYGYVELQFKMVAAAGAPDIDYCYFMMEDTIASNGYTAQFANNVSGITSITSDTWYTIRIPLSYGAGNREEISEFWLKFGFDTPGNHTVYFDNLFIEKTEQVVTILDENSIKTFGLFEKRKRDSNLFSLPEVTASAQALLNPYPKMNYPVTARGYVPIRLNQTIGVRWKEVDWVLPLTQNKMTLKAGVTTSHLMFGGMPLSADDINVALASENRAETYGKVVHHNTDTGYNHDTVSVDDGVPEAFRNLIGLKAYKGKSPDLIAAYALYLNWEDFNIYKHSLPV